MNIPMLQTPHYQSTNTHQGNSGNGSRINKPTIPTIQYNPPTDFVVGQYNNNIQPTVLSTLYSDTDKLYYHSNNPVDGKDWVNSRGLNGRGGNKGSHYKPNNWSPYVLQDTVNTQQTSQTFPYNTNSSFIQGSTRRAWASFESSNVNNSVGGLEQITPQNEIVPMERTEEDMYNEAVKKLKDEMD